LSRRGSEWFTLSPILADSGNAGERNPFGAAWNEAAKTRSPERATTAEMPDDWRPPGSKPR
jgi:hypothetical protein